MNSIYNTKVFHIDQSTTEGFVSLRKPWVSDIFLMQLERKAMDFGIIILNYVIMTNHYHLELVFQNEKAVDSFMTIFLRDVSRMIKRKIRLKLIKEDLTMFLDQKIFQGSPYYVPVFSLKVLWIEWRYIVRNPQEAKESITSSSEFFLSGAFDICKGNKRFINFEVLRLFLGEQDLVKCIKIAELSKEDFESYLSKKLANWTEEDDQKILRLNDQRKWQPVILEDKKKKSAEPTIDNLKKYGLSSKMNK